MFDVFRRREFRLLFGGQAVSVLGDRIVADRVPRRAVMVASDLVRFVSQGAIAALLVAGVADVWMLALLAGVTGAATGFFGPASTGLLPEIVLAEHLQPANALRTSAVSTGEMPPEERGRQILEPD